MSEDLLLVKEFKKRVFDESYTRIFKCLDQLNEDQIWFQFNEHTNSIGNLILHLHGNMRQWMMSTFNQSVDTRKRSLEFVAASRVSKSVLKKMLLDLKEELETVLDRITKDDVEKKYKVQVYTENGVSIMVHVIEHFSYHTGQIALITKLLADKDLEFYPYSLE
jgi:uncharacterized damage-inducible protein DinB